MFILHQEQAPIRVRGTCKEASRAFLRDIQIKFGTWGSEFRANCCLRSCLFQGGGCSRAPVTLEWEHGRKDESNRIFR